MASPWSSPGPIHTPCLMPFCLVIGWKMARSSLHAHASLGVPPPPTYTTAAISFLGCPTDCSIPPSDVGAPQKPTTSPAFFPLVPLGLA